MTEAEYFGSPILARLERWRKEESERRHEERVFKQLCDDADRMAKERARRDREPDSVDADELPPFPFFPRRLFPSFWLS